MKRFFIILTITCLLIPFFTINSSAATYELGSPSLWFYSATGTSYTTPYFSFYSNLGDYFYGRDDSYRLLFYPNGYQSEPGFDNSYSLDLLHYPVSYNDVYPSYENAGFRYRATGIDIQKNVLAFVCGDTVRDSLVIPGIFYKDIMLPASDQYLKVQFSVDTVKLGTSYDIPDIFTPLLQPEYLCFFEVDGRNSNTEPSVFVPFSSVVVEPSNNGRVLTYTYYFNSSGEAFNSLREDNPSALIDLVIRFPYYFGNTSQLSNGVFILSNYDFPVSYEIITPGGYSQELEGIQNAITVSNEKLLDYYDTMTGDDRAVIVIAQRQNQKLDSTIKDYDNAQEGVDNIVENVTLPPVNIDDANASFEDLGLGDLSTNQYIWQGPVIAMAVVTFSFAILSLILYGKKE